MNTPARATAEPAEPSGCLGEIGWLGAGFVLPCVSPTFYRLAARRSLGGALLFFLLFTLAISTLLTLAAMRGLGRAGEALQGSFERGEFPEITISGGVAEVSGPQPRVLVDEAGTLVVLDTTGIYAEIDRTRYDQGFLLTRTSLHLLDQNGTRYQELPLSQLQDAFGDPILINAQTVASWWTNLSPLLALVIFLGLAVWHVLVRLVYLVVVALPMWGVAAAIKRGTDFGRVLTVGLYAILPAIYLNYLLGQINIGFLCLGTLLLVPFWALGLVAALATRQPGSLLRAERPLRGWRALLGAPLLIVLALDAVLAEPNTELITWSVALLTFAVLVAVGLWTARSQGRADLAAPPADRPL